jgi:hypothetical protein
MFKTFYIIELLHGFFADTRSRQLRVVPTTECSRLLAGRRMLVRQVGNRFYVLVWTDQNSVPLMDIEPEAVFRFYLIADDPAFYDFTTLPYDAAKPVRLYLSNLSNNQANGRLYLTQPIAVFNGANNYTVGDLAASAANLFENIQSAAGHPVTDASFWAPRGGVRASSSKDVLPFTNADVSITLPAPAGNATVNIFGLNRANNQFDRQLLSTNLNFPSATTTVPVHFGQTPNSQLPGGKYRVTAGGQEQFFYYDPALRPGAVLGVVEIFNHLAAADPYSLLDAAGKVKGTMFSVLFLNPIVIWKYIARTTGVKAIKDQSGTYQFDNSVALQFRSKTPIPLTDEAYDQIAMDYKPATATTQTTYQKVVNPSPTNRKQIVIGADTLPCAEIYLNY